MLFDTTHYTYETIVMVFSGFSFYSDIFILLDEFLSQLFEFKTCKLRLCHVYKLVKLSLSVLTLPYLVSLSPFTKVFL